MSFKPKINLKKLEFRFDMSGQIGPSTLIGDLKLTAAEAETELERMGFKPNDVCLIGCKRDSDDPNEVIITYLLLN